MRHSAFVCPAASINYDLLKWISLGALESWPKRLDGHMCLSEQVHHSRDSRSADNAGDPASSQAGTVGGKMKQGERPKDGSVCPVPTVTRRAGTARRRDLAGARTRPAPGPAPAAPLPASPERSRPPPRLLRPPRGFGGSARAARSGRPPDSRSPLTLRLLPSQSIQAQWIRNLISSLSL